MHIYYLILLLLQFIIKIQAQQQQDGVTTTLYNTLSNNMTTKVMDDIRTTVTMLTATATSTIATTSNATTMANNNSTTKTASLPFFSPSPTSFVYTHFPVFPLHTGSSSSVMSSARPSQSAPFPDDTIGKYGRLHISKAPYRAIFSWLYSGCILSCLISFYFLS